MVATVIRNYSLSDITDSVKYLLDLASKDMGVRQLAIEVTSNTKDKISAIYSWIKENISYVPDPIGFTGDDIELFISPVKMVKDYSNGLRPGGDCDDHALLSTALFRAIGIPSNVVLMDSVGQGIDHAYCQVRSEKLNRWVSCDTTTNAPLGWEFSNRFELVI